MKDKNTKTSDWSSTAIKLGIGLIAIAFLIYLLSGQLTITLTPKQKASNFEVTNAVYFTDFHEGAMNLTYTGFSPVNVSVYHEFYFDGEKMNKTDNLGIMKKDDWHLIAFYGYVTWCKVIYDGNEIKLFFTPKRMKYSEYSP